MKSLEFFKPILATTLAIVLAWLLSVRAAQAGYTVTLQQVGPDVVATGSGAIDLTGLTFSKSGFLVPQVTSGANGYGSLRTGGSITTGPFSSMPQDPRQSVDSYSAALIGPATFGTHSFGVDASSGSGNMVGMGVAGVVGRPLDLVIAIPRGYVSGTVLADSATYRGTTLLGLGVTPGTYVWRWGTGANQNFTLQIEAPVTTNISNFSTRASVQTGQGVAIAGFIVTGTGSKSVVLRGLGPTLTGAGVSGALADPTLQLVDGSGHPMGFNDNWKDTQQAQIQATGVAPPNDLESAILGTLAPGNYTAILSGRNDTTGIGLVEVYDVATGAVAELTNVSTRGFVGTDDAVMIGGFITSGATQVVVRGLGPTLTEFGVSGTLADPALTLVDSNGNIVRGNNNWKDSQQVAVQATGLAPPNDLEAAILATVAAGNYTAILSGNGGGTGIGLVEVYKL